MRTGDLVAVDPRIGRWALHLNDAIADFSGPTRLDRIAHFVGQGLQVLESGEFVSDDKVRYLFVLTLLVDIVRAGGRAEIREGRVYVAWPNFDGPDGRDLARRALSNLAQRSTSPSRSELLRASNAFLENVDEPTLTAILSSGRLRLEQATLDNVHQCGRSYAELFALALRYWNMPIRSREGRSRRFVATLDHPLLGRPVVAGLIEIGDDAPVNVQRDRMLGLVPESLAILATDPQVRREVADTFQRARVLLGAVEGIASSASYDEVLSRSAELGAKASGITRLSEGWERNKKIVYLLRLARGERALRMTEPNPLGDDFRAGVRAWHDLVVPRIHQEITICGAVPPFSSALGGKLVITLLAHPLIREALKGASNQIVRKTFEEDPVHLLPETGVVLLTTKGLYPKYSRQYDRAVIPGNQNSVRMTRIGHTEGDTTTLLSDRTAQLARAVLDRSALRKVSSTYGTGGGKKARQIISALAESGLPSALAFAGIRRPIYALPLARNLEDIVWRHAAPDWAIPIDVSSESYCEKAFALWRSRWLEPAVERLAHSSIKGLFESTTESAD